MIARPGRVLVALALVGALFVAADPPRRARAAVKARRPNILVIVTDDQRPGTVSHMPFTSRMFKTKGVRYAKAFATTPTCCPSRASIFTGLYAHNHGVITNDHDLVDHSKTMQAYLQRSGYRTGLVGKFLNSWGLSATPPFFDRWAMTDGGYFTYRVNIDGDVSSRTRYHTDFVRTQMLRMLKGFDQTEDRKPWFLYAAPYAPHAPATPNDRYADLAFTRWDGNDAVHEIDRTDKPSWVQESHFGIGAARNLRSRQLRSLQSVDDLVKNVTSSLRRMGELDNTLLLFLSDNGNHWGEHGLRAKGTPYDGSTRIPLLARWDGRLPGGAVASHYTANIDLAPSVLDAANVVPWVPMDGRTFLSRGPRRDRILLEHWGVHPDWASLRTEDYQYIEYYDETGQVVTFREYYEFPRDPWELENYFADRDPINDPRPEDVAALSADLMDARDCSGADCP